VNNPNGQVSRSAREAAAQIVNTDESLWDISSIHEQALAEIIQKAIDAELKNKADICTCPIPNPFSYSYTYQCCKCGKNISDASGLQGLL
jgi:methionine aminopeptidase